MANAPMATAPTTTAPTTTGLEPDRRSRLQLALDAPPAATAERMRGALAREGFELVDEAALPPAGRGSRRRAARAFLTRHATLAARAALAGDREALPTHCRWVLQPAPRGKSLLVADDPVAALPRDVGRRAQSLALELRWAVDRVLSRIEFDAPAEEPASRRP